MEQVHSTTTGQKWKQLTEKDRYQLEAYFNTGMRTQEIAERMGYSKRTIERERALGLTEQLKPASKDIKTCGDLQKQWVYLADVAQRRHDENSACKGRNLKIGNDHRLVEHIENKIKKEKEEWSPAAVLGNLEQKGWLFAARICVKTLYNYIDRDLFLGISNKDLLQKKKGKKQGARKVRKVAWNNRAGKSIEERPEHVNQALRQTMVQSSWMGTGCKRQPSAMQCTTPILSAAGNAGATRTGTVFCADFCRKEPISAR